MPSGGVVQEGQRLSEPPSARDGGRSDAFYIVLEGLRVCFPAAPTGAAGKHILPQTNPGNFVTPGPCRTKRGIPLDPTQVGQR